MRCIVVACVILVGCDGVGHDIDGDGVADENDDCLATGKDAKRDVDGDGKDASVDLCPNDKNAASGDLDFDDIPDACDPFLGEMLPDTRRCVTSFVDRDANAEFFLVRAGETGWEPAGPLHATGDVSFVASRPLPYKSTTFDVLGTGHFGATGSFKIWLRADATPSNADVACGIDAGHVFVIANGAKNMSHELQIPIDGTFRLHATVQADNRRENVLCRATSGGMTESTGFMANIGDGPYGFAASGDVTIESVVIDSRDDAPPI